MSCGDARVAPAGSLYHNLPDEILRQHVIPKLGDSDRFVLSRVDRHLRALVGRDALPRPIRQGFQDRVTLFHDGGRALLHERELRGNLLFGLQGSDFVTSVTRLQWARENGFPWVESICAAAAAGGHLNVLQWARENDCPWNESTCAAAAQKGHLEVLMWAREHGCPWDE
uniref:Uncharacterized protein n=1 Tax=Mantoniella antarctica TaxID=81844 RepID=A0A7S0T4X1_9CHLO|mmetsp:Transcript_9493/g.23420  ORF Transcript_9493/g.23420 Transcript_9493/m.23420 type:complete len:170 (+) Transcript_9493:146-655(+)